MFGARERQRVAQIRARARNAIGTGELRPGVAAARERKQALERRLSDALRGVRQAHVVDHHLNARALDGARKSEEGGRLAKELHVPAEWRDEALGWRAAKV